VNIRVVSIQPILVRSCRPSEDRCYRSIEFVIQNARNGIGNMSALAHCIAGMDMKPNTRISAGAAKTDNLFYMGILAALIGCTLFSGATAIVLATGMLNEATVNVAQVP
jgi:hypothetical protein